MMRWKFWSTPPAPTKAIARSEPRIVVSEELLAYATARQAPRNPFQPARPLPGVVPAGATDMAMDDDIRAVTNWAGNGSFGDGMFWLGYAELAELSQRPEYRRISSVKAKEMTRKWIKLNAGSTKNQSEEIRQLMAAIRRFKVQDLFRRCAELDGNFGRSHIYIDTGDTDNPDELKTILSLHPDKITKGSLKGFKVVEAIWTYPGVYNSTDPLKKDFYKPQTWFVMGKEVHSSRFLTFIGNEMPDILKPAYMFGGISLTQMAKPYVDLWIHDRTAVSEAVEYFSTSVLKTNMAAAMQQGGDAPGLLKRLKFFVKLRKNRGVLAIDKETEDFVNVSMQLGTLDKLQAQAQEHVCSSVGMPLVKYTGITPAGLNASSDGEIRVWYDDIHADQEDVFTDNLTTVLKVLQLNEFGRIDENITHEFVALFQLDEAGKAAVQKTKADTAAVLIQEGVVSPEEDRERLAGDSDSMYGSVDLTTSAPIPPEDGDAPSLEDDASRIASSGANSSDTGANAFV